MARITTAIAMLTLVPAWVSSCCARGPLVDLADQPSQGRPLAVAVRHRRSGCKQGPSKKGQNGFRQHGAGSQSIPVVDSATGSQIRGFPSTGNLGKALQGFSVFSLTLTTLPLSLLAEISPPVFPHRYFLKLEAAIHSAKPNTTANGRMKWPGCTGVGQDR